MDGPPPPVPPNDTPNKPFMDADRTTPAPASGSKRKREGYEHAYNLRSDHVAPPDSEAHTPNKRSRPSLQPSDNDASDDATPVQPRTVRRKKGLNNLSNLNLRHAAERQARLQAESQPLPRESKFQEGSLTDRPSDQPPSAFTRFVRTDSGNIQQINVDELMDDYHNGMPSPHRSKEIDIEPQTTQIPPSAPVTSSQGGSTDENNGFLFRFGRSLAASFHPVRMWKQVWEETTEDLRQRNLAEIERKRILKEEAERRYAQMKASGQFEPKVLSRAPAADSNVITRDSGVILSGGTPSLDYKRDVPRDSQPTLASNYSMQSESEAQDSAPSVVKTFRPRLSFKRPSLQNLHLGVKRTKSEYNLAGAANAYRDSSSSVSPAYPEVEGSGIKKSQSRIDMRKQHKLSKRVSDLESKLSLARKELNSALTEASPMPKLNGKHERFTPHSTIKRPRFVPGKLESLPSERLLDPSQFDFEIDEADKVMNDRARAAFDLEGRPSEAPKGVDLMDLSNENEDDTIRASRAQKYPTRASSLFNLNNKNIEDIDDNITAGADNTTSQQTQGETMDMAQLTEANKPQSDTKNTESYATLDAKLKALDANVKMAAKKPTQRKKRKSGEDLHDYKPGKDDEDDDDAEWEKLGVRAKRRKSGGSTKKKAADKAGTTNDEIAAPAASQVADDNDAEVPEVNKKEDDLANKATVRLSLDSQSAHLEPVSEEESEEVATGDPAKKLAPKPAHTRTHSYQPDTDHELMARAAAAARKHRSHSPQSHEDTNLSKQLDGNVEQSGPGAEKKSAKATRSTRGRSKKGTSKVDESFEWPEDVF